MEPPHHTGLALLMITSLSFLTNQCYLTTVAAARPAGNETDRLALLAFKSGITRDPLGSFRSWNSTLHFCQWTGVTCGRQHRRVVGLDLQGRGLAGTISPHVGNLSFLRELRLTNNSFGGVIPQEIGRLSRLEYLHMENNTIGGGIPTNLSYCSELRVVYLVGNQLVGSVPAELGSLSKLTALGLGINGLSGSIPPSLGNLSSLTVFSIGRSNLEGSIPDDLGRLTNLLFFQVGGNNLSGRIPPSLFNLSNIYYFVATGNNLIGNLPPNLGLTLPKLNTLALSENHFSGPIPISLTNASRLAGIDLVSNNLIGPIPQGIGALRELNRLNLGSNHLGSSKGNDLINFITSLTNCSNLRTLAVHENQLKGPLPNSVANLSTKLNLLLLGRNMISGSIPMGIGNLVSLTGLGLGGNLLEGTIPSTIGNLYKLEALELRTNRLSGKIPTSLGNISSLSMLALQENMLEGEIPWSIRECQRLQALDLSENRLEGAIPRQLFELSYLSVTVNLAHNSLTGPIPVEVGNLKSLTQLVLSDNGLTNTIPTTLGDCTGLERLYLDDNSFEGDIPTSLGNLKGIRELNLSHNRLTGQIPAYLASPQCLNYLNLSSNDLSGQIPKGGIFDNASAAVSLQGNSNLCGGIPVWELPACPIHASNGGRMPRRIKRTILILCAVLLFSIVLVATLFVLWMRKKSERKPCDQVSSEEDQYRRISYLELFRATDGFSSNNLVGVGSYGAIYKGQLDHDQAIVAIKVLNMQQRGASKSFLSECKALRSVRHRNLVKIITMCSSLDHNGNDFKALVLEFMSNGSLDEWLHAKEEAGQSSPKHLDLLQRLHIAVDVASALHYLHQHGSVPIVHCDLKPSNILLDEGLTAHVGDFGLARFLSKAINMDASEAQSSSMGIVKGTIGYIPPEYGMGGEASIEGDVYSYGILLLEMFTGRRPTNCIFEGNLNLRKFVKSAFPHQVMDVVDPSLFTLVSAESNLDTTSNVSSEWKKMRKVMEGCLANVVEIGLSCCSELPHERPVMGDIVVKLQKAREAFPKKA